MYNQYYGMQPQQPVYQEDLRNIEDVCRKYRNFHVIGQMSDGTQMEGILEDYDDEGITMLVPEEVDEAEVEGMTGTRGFGPYGRRRFRRFRRRRFPRIVFVFPFFFPYPYYAYPYGYPYYG
ncbi:hypothetical protein SAMN05877753_110150 [Bacillus oleivorans]|uniref:Uncharacterized protein n=1 Tax=Bacillus oleivorans TaxID=1448271 RepID=A0A285D562_9BACI|nr:hypothetical protein [Bacillus oleivorans]SNX74909.1 hypothetical protein SAMN05877753_110150 [Bacillus oleivorans]